MNGGSLFGIIIGLIAFVCLSSSLTAGKWRNRLVFYYGGTCEALDNKDTEKKGFMGKLGQLVKKAVDCCIE